MATRLQARAVVAAHAVAPQQVAGRGQLHAWSHLTGHDPDTVAPLSLGSRLHSKYWLLRGRCWSAAQHPPAIAIFLQKFNQYSFPAVRPYISLESNLSRLPLFSLLQGRIILGSQINLIFHNFPGCHVISFSRAKFYQTSLGWLQYDAALFRASNPN